MTRFFAQKGDTLANENDDYNVNISTFLDLLPFTLHLDNIGKSYTFEPLNETISSSSSSIKETRDIREQAFPEDGFRVSKSHSNLAKLVELDQVILPPTVTSMKCNWCDHTIVPRPTITLRRLPDRAWMELVDCWSCHRGEFAIVSDRLVTSEDGQNILPKPGFVFYDNLYFIVPSLDYQYCECNKGIKIDNQFISILKSDVQPLLSSTDNNVSKQAIGTNSAPSLFYLLFNDLKSHWVTNPAQTIQISSIDGSNRLTLKIIGSGTLLKGDRHHFFWLIKRQDSDLPQGTFMECLYVKWDITLLNYFTHFIEKLERHPIQKFLQKYYHDDDFNLLSIAII